MANPPDQEAQSQISYLLSDFNTRLRDLEERNRAIRERVLLIGQNLIASREEIDNAVVDLKKQTSETKKELDKIKQLVENIVSEFDKFARKDEMILVEKMLKDFQPIKFARIEDVEDMINEKLGKKNEQSVRRPSPTQGSILEQNLANTGNQKINNNTKPIKNKVY